MACIKCGRETGSEQIFCQRCLELMKKYPVEPETVIQLPHRKAAPAAKRPPKKTAVNLEKRVEVLSTRIRWLVAFLVLLVILCGILGIPAYRYQSKSHLLPGQNYTVITPSTASEPAQEPEAVP